MVQNKDVVLMFLYRSVDKNANLRSTGIRLFSYNTCIAQWYAGKLIVNKTKYSTTTSRHTGLLLRNMKDFIGDTEVLYVDSVPRGSQDLVQFIKY